MFININFKKFRVGANYLVLFLILFLPLSVSAIDDKLPWMEIIEAYEDELAVVEIQPLNITVSEESFVLPSFTLGNTIYVPLRDLGEILNCKIVFDVKTQTASLVKTTEMNHSKSNTNFIKEKKTVYLNKKITATYQNIEFGKCDSTISGIVPGFVCEGKLFVRLGTVTQLLGYVRSNKGDGVKLKQESHMLRNNTPRNISWIMGEEWEKIENNGTLVPIALTEEAMDIQRGIVSDGRQIVTDQRTEVYRHKETGVLRIFVYTDGYLWTPDQGLNIAAYYDVLDKPSKEGSLFGVMGGYYSDK